MFRAICNSCGLPHSDPSLSVVGSVDMDFSGVILDAPVLSSLRVYLDMRIGSWIDLNALAGKSITS